MTPRPLSEIRLRPSDHLSALWWLGLLYRRPRMFGDALRACSRPEQLIAGLCICLHSLPYIFMLIAGGRAFLFGIVGFPVDPRLDSGPGTPPFFISHIAVGIAFGTAGGIAVGVAVGVAFGIAAGIAFGITFGIAFGIAVGIAVGIPSGFTFGVAFGIAFGVAFEIAFELALGIAFEIALGITLGIAFGIAFGIVGGVAFGIPFGIAVGIRFGIVFGNAFGPAVGALVGITVSMVVGTAVGIAGVIAFGIAGGITVGIALGIAFGIAGSIVVPRCYYHVVHPAFVWPRARGAWYRFHPVAWDDRCAVPFPGLDLLLVAYAEKTPELGRREIHRLVFTYPSQRDAALRAETRLIAREAGRANDLTQLVHLVAGLPERKEGVLEATPRIRQMVGEIAHLQARLNTVERPVLREPLARLLRTEVENFQHRVSGFHEPLASEFRAAAEQWVALADRQLQKAAKVVEREPTPQVFRAGDPVDREREAFVSRDRVVGKLEQQVLLSTGCPGIVLYGRRRMGKSTALRNLEGFLPPTVPVVTISMQQAEAFASLESLITLFWEAIRGLAWPGGFNPGPARENLTDLSRLLSACNEVLGTEGRRLIVAFDEYENIDRKIGEGVFPQDLLAMIRESIQTHRNLIWTFAGSHEIDELNHAPWTSYLVSARNVEVPPFTEAETRLLLTEPLRSSTLWPKDDPSRSRPRFPAEFWGPNGIECIHAEAGGWPHLVQLIAETVVDLLNDEGRRQVDAELFERALDEAIVRGHNVLYELMRGESSLPGEWEYLAAFRRQEAQPPPDDDAIGRSLRRRLLICEEGDNGPWRLRVPLMRRWLLKRG